MSFSRTRSQREIDHAAWFCTRENARTIAGPRFDLKRFHHVPELGAMPLWVLEERAQTA